MSRTVWLARRVTRLVAAHRSITEPSIQRIYRNYVRAWSTSFTRTIWAWRPNEPHPRDRAATRLRRRGANDKHARPTTFADSIRLRHYRSTSACRSKPRGELASSAHLQDRPGFARLPFMNVIGLSSYPYLGGFKNPEEIPLDYLQPGERSRKLPVTVGGRMAVGVGARSILVSARDAGEIHRAPGAAARCSQRHRAFQPRSPTSISRASPKPYRRYFRCLRRSAWSTRISNPNLH